MIVQSQRARISKEGETLKIADEEKGDTMVRLNDVSDVALFGNVSITTPALATLMDRDIPVAFHSHGGWFRGGHPWARPSQCRGSHRAIPAQFRRELLPEFRSRLGRRQDRQPAHHRAPELAWRPREPQDRAGPAQRGPADQPRVAASTSALLGLEGDSASTYFRAFAELLAPPGTEKSGRTRPKQLGAVPVPRPETVARRPIP